MTYSGGGMDQAGGFDLTFDTTRQLLPTAK